MMIRVNFAIVATWLVMSSAAASDATEYTFEKYMEEFGKVYDTKEEKEARRAIFGINLEEIAQHNKNNAGHILKVNQWADRRLPEELPLGLHKKPNGLNFLNSKKPSAVEEFYQTWLESTVPVSDLPTEVDWRAHDPKVTTDVKDQGMCGSCWAVASTTVLESHIALQTGKLFTLSPQELVSCVENPLHCGGSGGCQGAIYELAFEYVMEHGMVLETTFPYKAKNGKCTLKNATSTDAMEGLLRGTPADTDVVVNEDGYFQGGVATIDGYINFPSNNYTALMNGVATLGPIGITVAASKWAFYGGGVFDLPDHNSSDATSVNHAVVLEGYGVDQETQELYWLVRNSWGEKWGEDGYIRLKRVDPSTIPDFDKDDCGIDTNTADGAGCTKDKDGNDIVPKPVKVCGTTAILYDTFVPVGGRLLSNKARTAAVEEQ